MRTFFLVLVLAVRSAAEAFSVSALLTDHAVLQTSASGGRGPGVVRGTAKPGATITLRSTGVNDFPGAPYKATATAAGTWAIKLADDASLLKSKAALGPFDVVVSDGTASVSATDLFYGDVFFCGGQSNMVYTVDAIHRAQEELAAANHPNIRLFQLARDQSPNLSGGNRTGRVAASAGAIIRPYDARDPIGTPFGLIGAPGAPTPAPAPPLRDVAGSCLYGSRPSNPCDAPVRQWARANATVVGRFSAVCYLAARDVLLNRTSSGAVGLIESDYGGTPLQAWSPAPALSACGMSRTNCSTYSGGRCLGYPSRLFNRMVAPFAGWGLRTFVFYQGEANSDEGFPLSRAEYGCLFAAMIDGWRRAWASAAAEANEAPAVAAVAVVPIPFVFVQLSAWTGNWGFEGLPCVATYCPVIARIKLAQADVAGLGGSDAHAPWDSALAGTGGTSNIDGQPHKVGMAVADDWGATQNEGVHPPFKTQPAQRVARQVLKLAYDNGLNVTATGPVVVNATVLPKTSNSTTVTVEFKFVDNADVLTLQGTNDCDQQYSKKCCGADGTLGPIMGRFCTHTNATLCAADAGSNGDNGIYPAHFALDRHGRLTATATIANGQAVRFVDYQMTDFPQCKLVNSAGLPLSTFGPFAVNS